MRPTASRSRPSTASRRKRRPAEDADQSGWRRHRAHRSTAHASATAALPAAVGNVIGLEVEVGLVLGQGSHQRRSRPRCDRRGHRPLFRRRRDLRHALRRPRRCRVRWADLQTTSRPLATSSDPTRRDAGPEHRQASRFTWSSPASRSGPAPAKHASARCSTPSSPMPRASVPSYPAEGRHHRHHRLALRACPDQRPGHVWRGLGSHTVEFDIV